MAERMAALHRRLALADEDERLLAEMEHTMTEEG